jgi:hypothetical protein
MLLFQLENLVLNSFVLFSLVFLLFVLTCRFINKTSVYKMGMQIVYFMLFQTKVSIKHILKRTDIVEYDAFYTSTILLFIEILIK